MLLQAELGPMEWVFIGIGILAFIFIVLAVAREFWCWLTKVNYRIKLQKQTNHLLNEIVKAQGEQPLDLGYKVYDASKDISGV